MLQRLTNNFLKSTTHRVRAIGTEMASSRYSIPFFSFIRIQIGLLKLYLIKLMKIIQIFILKEFTQRFSSRKIKRNKINVMDYLQPTLGFLALLSLGVIFSEDIRSIKIRYVISGVLIQLGLVILLTKIEIVSTFFSFLSDGVMVLKAANDYGTGFVFGYLADGAPNAPFEVTNPGGTFIFAFGGLTLIIVMSAISALLWKLKVIPFIVNAISILFKKPLNVGGPIGLATSNIFLGQVEAPLLIKPYLSSMTRHELLIIMTVGMSTIAGSVMVVYTTMLFPIYGAGLIGHFLSASLISVPAAIMYSNIMLPSDVKQIFQTKKFK